MQSVTDKVVDLAGPLRRFVRRRVADPHAADDIAQDVMLKLQANLDALPPGERLAAWMYRTARNAIVDHYRARAVRAHADVIDSEPAAPDAQVEQAQVVGDLSGCLARMVERLDEPYRQAVKLADLEGLTQQALARRMGVSLSGAKSRVQRGRRQLRAMIDACCRVEVGRRGSVVSISPTPRSAEYCGPAGARENSCVPSAACPSSESAARDGRVSAIPETKR
jgi:RNA polymerase sigma-70 factor, ECF subfamily